MRFGFFLKEALRGLRRSSAPALAALLTVLLTALVLGVFIPVVQATTGTANEVRSRVLVDVFIKDGATSSEKAQLKRALENTSNVKSVEFLSKKEALEETKQKNPGAFKGDDLPDLLGRNPLPDTFRVTPDDPDKLDVIVDRLLPTNAEGVREPQLAGVDGVKRREHDTDKILSATSLVKVVTAGLAALLVFASIALIANTIRLSIFARRREVEVMKLVGATNWFIRWPFVIEGVIVGFMGGVLAVLVLTIAKETFIDPLSDRFALLAAPDTIDFPLLIVVLMVACIAVSALGSGITLRRFLRV
jgi:cell division transport system permease protein